MAEKEESFVKFLREAKLPTSVTANIQPMKDLKRHEHGELYKRAFRNILKDLRRAGYHTEQYDQWTEEELDRKIEQELYSMLHYSYEAMPSLIDMMVYPKHQVLDTSSQNWTLPKAPTSALEWRTNWENYQNLWVLHNNELPPRIYVHFACFPENTVFKEKQFMAVTNNLHENCGVTSKDIVVIVTHNEANATLLSRKIYQSYVNMVMKGEQGNFVIHFTLQQLQVDIQSHLLVPPARVLHCRRERDEKLKAIAYIENPDDELPEIDVDDAHIRRLFAKPMQVIETMMCSENELDSLRYYLVTYKEQNY